MTEDLDVTQLIEPVLPKGVIDISHEIALPLSLDVVRDRVQNYFKHENVGYKKISKDSFRLKVRGKKYPVFGSYTGKVHIYEKLEYANRPLQKRSYAIEGMLHYRMSTLWFLGVLSFFFLVNYVLSTGFWIGVVIEAIASGIVLFITHNMGLEERDETAENIEASFLKLRAIIQNIR